MTDEITNHLHCEWEYNRKVRCGNLVSNETFRYCMIHRVWFDGKVLCKGHQMQYLLKHPDLGYKKHA